MKLKKKWTEKGARVPSAILLATFFIDFIFTGLGGGGMISLISGSASEPAKTSLHGDFKLEKSLCKNWHKNLSPSSFKDN